MGQIKPEASGYPSAGLGFTDTLNSLEAQYRLPARIKADFHEAIQLAREFNDEVLRPVYLGIDRKVMEDNEYLPLDFIRKANVWGLYTLWIPKMYGGQGMNMLSLYTFMEELSSVCAGLANLIGAHYLGVSVLCSSCNMKITNRILRDVVSEAKKGNPCLISLAWTEPGAGTDQVEGPLLDRAKVRTQATRVEGGYVVNGSKVFISAGHVSTWHMLICYEDIRKPADTLIMLAVKTGMKGFSFGHKEQKMGQKACVASELIFEDCFVPDEYVCFSKDQVRRLGITAKEAGLKLIGMFPSVTQPGVAAISTGIARAACEAAREYVAKKKVAGEFLINQEWVQMVIADMYTNVVAARAIYMEAAYAAGLMSMIRLLFNKALFYLTIYTPAWMFTLLVAPLFNLEIVNHIYRKLNFEMTKAEDERHMSGLGSLTKFSCSDMAVANCAKALDLMGVDGTRHDAGAEKLLRDAKLLQIYEGTNEANRINLFSMHIAPGIPGVRVFE
ncbi:MAG: acyl-CoA dehydrogenase family protein [Desulfomonilia bacterium]|jgi:alkylation response protein AidB-like acyl-CoA dehydrogenase